MRKWLVAALLMISTLAIAKVNSVFYIADYSTTTARGTFGICGDIKDFADQNSTSTATNFEVIRGTAIFRGSVTAPRFYGEVARSSYSVLSGTATWAFISSTSYNSLIANYAATAGTATFTITAGTATYAQTVAVQRYALTAATAAYANLSSTASYASVSGSAATASTATYAVNSGTAAWATGYPIPIYANTSSTATYASTAATAAYSNNSAAAISAVTATSATYATNAGSSLYAYNSTTASYAVLSATQPYARTASTSAYSINSGTATWATAGPTPNYARFSSTATYAYTAGAVSTSTYAVNSGTAVYSQDSVKLAGKPYSAYQPTLITGQLYDINVTSATNSSHATYADSAGTTGLTKTDISTGTVNKLPTNRISDGVLPLGVTAQYALHSGDSSSGASMTLVTSTGIAPNQDFNVKGIYSTDKSTFAAGASFGTGSATPITGDGTHLFINGLQAATTNQLTGGSGSGGGWAVCSSTPIGGSTTTVYGQITSSITARMFIVRGDMGFQYWDTLFTSTFTPSSGGGGYVDLVATMTSNSAPSPFVASARSIHNASYDAWKAFDYPSGAGSFWVSSGNAPQWLQVYLGSAGTANEYTVSDTPGATGSNAPTAWTLQGSNDGSGWSVVASATGVVWSYSAIEVKYFPVTSPGAYTYYRLNITAADTDGAGWVAITKLRLLQ